MLFSSRLILCLESMNNCISNYTNNLFRKNGHRFGGKVHILTNLRRLWLIGSWICSNI
ncbi:hypothetical protein Patl1_14198 [Pistacia atlantica]|uniref:Uncharacterized protein n=1 Tax=Pistacia atlantica TaxID=434234 RepID=A0ACC1ATX9_9ROSI|nr:hypothetical protein Patl1_14198 [Pistacia atlantica]